MAKRKRERPSETEPTATNVDWPVFVPNGEGSTDIEVGRARLRYGTLVVEFKDSAPAVAIQNMVARGVLLGFGMIMLKPDVVNEMYQEVVENEEAVKVATAQAIQAGILAVNDEGKVYSINENQTVEEVVNVFLNFDKIAIDKPVDSGELKVVRTDESDDA